jgi:hypothetical protein
MANWIEIARTKLMLAFIILYINVLVEYLQIWLYDSDTQVSGFVTLPKFLFQMFLHARNSFFCQTDQIDLQQNPHDGVMLLLINRFSPTAIN